MRLFHIATSADWEAARSSGRYTTSTYGVSLAEEGFIHASRGDQWEGVRERFYAEVTEPLVLLVIDSDLLDVPVVEESPPGTDETFPHLYGALDPAAVVQVLPIDHAVASPTTEPPAEPVATQDSPSFSRLFFAEMFHNLMLAVLVMTCVAVGAVVGGALAPELGSRSPAPPWASWSGSRSRCWCTAGPPPPDPT